MFPQPTPGASLVLSFRLHQKRVLIIGSNSLAASRAFSALEADASVTVLAKGGLDKACDELKWRAKNGQLDVLDWDSLPGCSGSDAEVRALDSYMAISPRISMVYITDTLLSTTPTYRRTHASAETLYALFSSHNILVNTSDYPDLCDFSFTSTYRFVDEANENTSLQVGVTTNGKGCRLGGRVKREIVARLPKAVGGAVQKVGRLRELAKVEDDAVAGDETNEDSGVATPNLPVPLRTTSDVETTHETARRRMKWVAQVSEYWPLERLSRMTEEEMRQLLSNGSVEETSTLPRQSTPSQHGLQLLPPPGKIFLVGSGPGHPSLLTLAAHSALTKHAQLVVSDKLVPAPVLALIPKDVEVRIARKFPGNADGAQEEMMEVAADAARKGLTVVRLKQGDPAVYGRAGEEILYFRAQGFEPLIIPGVSSALAGPTFAGIPVTQRGVAESFVVCTGVGRKGKSMKLPGYDRGKTVIILMGVARLASVLSSLMDDDSDGMKRDGCKYPAHTPIALIERASMEDQRIIYGTLANIGVAMETVGEQRPPGMLVVGWAVLALWGKGDVGVLDEDGGEEKDEERVTRWLDGAGWRVREGVDVGWEGLW